MMPKMFMYIRQIGIKDIHACIHSTRTAKPLLIRCKFTVMMRNKDIVTSMANVLLPKLHVHISPHTLIFILILPVFVKEGRTSYTL